MTKQWWEPEVYKPGDEFYNEELCIDGANEDERWNFLCDHLNEANSVMTEMYKEVLKLRKQNDALHEACKNWLYESEQLNGDDSVAAKSLRTIIELAEKEHK